MQGVGAIAGILITPIFFTSYSSGTLLGLKGFIAAVLGGWGKNSGAILGGFALGIVESLSVAFIPAGYKDGSGLCDLVAHPILPTQRDFGFTFYR